MASERRARPSERVRQALSTQAPRYGLGLRAQIMVVLGVGFALSVLLLGLATVSLTARALDTDRRRGAQATALAIARSGDVLSLDAVVGSGGVVGAELEVEEHVLRRGHEAATEVEAREGTRVVRLWMEPTESVAARALSGLLFLYVGLTAAAILLVTYVLLTRAIVRPVEDLTRASERLSEGRDASVPVRGAAEIARLALSFNAMQSELRSERTTLQERLAELEHRTAELHAAQASLVRSEKLASVGRLAAGVAHEIGNPLAAILGLLELVRSGDLAPAEQHEFLGRVERETQRIHLIIHDLLVFARGEPQADEPDASCDPIEAIDDAVRLIGPQKDLRSVKFERRLPKEPISVRGSSSRLTQILLNLLLNAADAIGGEGTIRIDVERRDREVRIAISDTGPGISPEVRATLFEPFVTTKPAGLGTGLGLAVCHTIVERLGGTIEATDAPGGGACFEVRLPLA